ncbi:hypothetical protein B1759_08185 [Rubrivirga sp. SAORIC476]|uniref:hypothetical protein n=1 Tax=Rubrivirga sp. SAORIC476 TaxID=1961794 RepID=UPI000BA8E44B|nr:hypothetical protein [Rubrivirga sp. SAORIC476]PAP81300.1 hypothetical protein B1759_08185 [Rubrivirga sp. SAORIC476]
MTSVRFPSTRLVLAVGLAALVASAPLAQVQGVGYRLSPSATYVLFDGDAALSDGLLYGGGAGLSFGEFLELNGAYLLGDVDTDYSDLSGAEADLLAALQALDARGVNVQRYGGDLKLNLATGAVVPFLTGGAGVVRFSPDGSAASRSLYLLGGAGLQFAAADRYTVSISGEAFGYRYNPGTAFFTPEQLEEIGLGIGSFNQTEVINPSVRAALQLYLGGRRPGQLTDIDRAFQSQFSGGLSGLSLVVEPFYSRAEFDPAFNYSDQTFVGVEAGFDVGPLIGLRGFYGRGTASDDPTSFEDIQMVGGDLRLRLSDGDGFVPFLTVGAGYLDVLSEYGLTADDDPETNRALAEDRPFAVGGAGLEIPFGRRFRAIGEVRALVMSTQDEGDLSQPDDVYLSPVYRAGLSFGLGGSAGREVAVVRQSELDAERARAQADLEIERARYEAELAAQQAAAEAREAELQLAIEQARADGDSMAVARLELQRASTPLVAPTATLAADAVDGGRVGGDGVATSLPTPIRTTRGERIVTIPLPERGELYVRYGDVEGGSVVGPLDGTGAAPSPYTQPAPSALAPQAQAAPAEAVTEADLRQAVRDALREALAAQNATGAALTDADVAAIERRVENQLADRIGDRLRSSDTGITAADLAAMERRLEQRIALSAAPREAAPVVVATPTPDVVTPVAPAPTVVTPPGEIVAPTVAARQGVTSLSPTIGLGFGRSENALVGARATYRMGTITYLPELLVGVTGRRSLTATMDAAFTLPAASFAEYGAPYLRLGVGLVNTGASDEIPDTFDEEIDDGGTALTLNLGLGADVVYGGGRFFADFSTGNFGRYNRLTAGYRFPFGTPSY